MQALGAEFSMLQGARGATISETRRDPASTGEGQHPLYSILTESADDTGKAGNVSWNFEKFLVGRDGRFVRRFRSKVEPEDSRIVEAIETLL